MSLDLDKRDLMKIKLPLACSILFIFVIANLQAQTTFVNRVGSAYSDFGLACQPTEDQGIILVQEGSTNGMNLFLALSKIDSSGLLQWTKEYQIGEWCVPYSVLQAKDKGFVVLGSATDSSYINNNHHILFFYKTDVSGNPQWNKQFSISDNDIALNIVKREAGGYLAFSMADYNLGTYPKMAVTELDDSGNVVWSKQFSLSYGITGVKGIELPNRKICLVGSAGNPMVSMFTDVVVTVLDSSGSMQWTKTFGTSFDDQPNAVATNSSNEIFITGRSYFMAREWDSFLIRLDDDGNMIHSKFYDAGTFDGEVMRCVVARNDGSAILLGDIGTFDERDITMIQTDTSGDVATAKRYGFSPTFTNYPYEMFVANDGGIVFTGDYRPPTALRDAIIAKTENEGSLSCFTSPVSFTTYDDTITESMVPPSIIVSTVSTHAFDDSIPTIPVFSNVVCALATSVNENQHEDAVANIYPNPATDEVTISLNENHFIKKIVAYNVEGKMIMENDVNENLDQVKLNVRSLAAGMYFLEVIFDNGADRLRMEKF